MAKFTYDYYTIHVPGDMFVGERALESTADVAIDEARERARLYCIPAEWTATLVSGELGDWEMVFKVRRKRMRSHKSGEE